MTKPESTTPRIGRPHEKPRAPLPANDGLDKERLEPGLDAGGTGAAGAPLRTPGAAPGTESNT